MIYFSLLDCASEILHKENGVAISENKSTAKERESEKRKIKGSCRANYFWI